MAMHEQGSRVWVKVSDLWTPATSQGGDGTVYTFKTDDGENVQIENERVAEEVSDMHETSQNGVADMATLADLHEGALLYNIALRYKKNEIYTYIGSILSAVNPYKALPGCYEDEKILEYKGQPIGDLPPHIYAIANEAYTAMWKNDTNQAVLISGESGAGKTESTKFIMRFLSYMSNEVNKAKGNEAARNYEEQIVQSSPILEAFGNAKTVYNNNSSRFGKFIQLNFASSGVIEGAKIIDYLLEKNRVVRQNSAERNFHIFYQLLAKGPADAFGLTRDPSKYRYTSLSGTWHVDGIDDAADWVRVEEAFGTMNFGKEQIENITSVLAIILHLGNLEFTTQGGAQVSTRGVLSQVAKLLGVDEDNLGEVLTQQKRVLRGEEIYTPLDVEQAADSRDSMGMALYSSVFKWIISKLNLSLKGAESYHFVGVLDIFGFENFEHNTFEQFNINYANEKLQQYFNRHIFSLEQLEYNKEGIEWSDIDWIDNSECLDLIERKLGILSLLDEESRFPKGTDQSLLSKLHSSHGSEASSHYIRPRMVDTTFGIRHFAGEVMYDITGFLEKNRDYFRENIVELLQDSEENFIYDLFEHHGGAQSANRSTARKKPTVSFQFKESLSHLMATLSAASPFFVRCLKPNAEKAADAFTPQVVLNQLRYSGMMETVRIRRAGYPVRREFDDFMFRYRVLAQGISRESPVTDQCSALLKKYDADSKSWQLGKTKVFMREMLEVQLEKQRHVQIKATVQKIQAVILGYIQRKRYRQQREAIMRIQSIFKMFLVRQEHKRRMDAATTIQSGWRGLKARRLRAQLAEERRIEEERRKEEERKREEERKAEMARLEAEAKAMAEAERAEAQARLEEAKRQQAEEEARREAEAKQKKEDEERKMREAMERARELEEVQKRKEEESRRKAEEAARVAEEAAKQKEIDEQKRQLEEEQRVQEARAIREREEAQRQAMEEARFEESEEAEEVYEEEAKEGYLGMFLGVLNNLKRRWCVLHEGTLMWFKAKQDFIHAGWLTKMGGGTSTMGRKSWKRRWMTLKGGELHYMPSQGEEAEVLGTVDIQNCEAVSSEDIPMKKDNIFRIDTPKRTYYMYADTPEEMQEWIDILNTVKGATTEEINQMMDQARVNPRHAQGTIDVDDILSVGGTSTVAVEGHPTFVVMTSERVYNFVAKNKEDLDDWVRLLTPRKREGTLNSDVSDSAVAERGWMLKAGGKGNAFKRRRWFVLRGDVISYYKAKDDDYVVGTIPLNWLCSVIPPDETTATSKNDWTFTVHAKHKSFHLTCKTQADANRWINAIQDVIDNSPVIETPMEKLIDELKMASANEVEQIYATHKVLTYSSEPLRASLLPLPYGEISSPSSSRTYETLQAEALRVSASLLPAMDSGSGVPSRARYGSPDQPVELIRNIIQVCFDVSRLRNEVYCQVICQTSGAPNPGSHLNMVHWHLLAALCSSFLPSRKFVRYLRFHLKRTIELADSVGEEVVKVANFCLDALKTTKARDFPPSTKEIEAIMSGRGLVCAVHCVGDRVIEHPITSSTTCGEVIAAVKKQLDLVKCRNGFGLFENCGSVTKYLEDKYAVADVLSKWEKYEAHGVNPDNGSWRLVFKLFSFYDPMAPDLSGAEKEFLYEQAFETVMARKFPASDAELIKLAALRTQRVVGDWEEGAYTSDLLKVHPAQQPQLLAPDAGGVAGTMKRAGTMIKGTLKGLGSNTLRRLRGKTMKKDGEVSDKELEAIKTDITKEWKTLVGMSADDALEAYMRIITAWPGWGCNIFDVVQASRKDWPKELWLAISLEGVGIFKRNSRDRLAFFPYQSILSFGAPVNNKYKILVDGSGTMLFETQQVLEIAKLMKEYIKEIVSRRR